MTNKRGANARYGQASGPAISRRATNAQVGRMMVSGQAKALIHEELAACGMGWEPSSRWDLERRITPHQRMSGEGEVRELGRAADEYERSLRAKRVAHEDLVEVIRDDWDVISQVGEPKFKKVKPTQMRRVSPTIWMGRK